MIASNRPATRITVFILTLLCNHANADVETGIAAYQRGDYAAAFVEFSDAARQNDSLALNVLGIMNAEGRGVARNDKLAVDLFFKAQTLGSLEAGANLGRMYADGRGVPQSNTEALRHYREAALGGYVPAMRKLAEIYEGGELGIAPDPALAMEWRARLGGTPTGLMHRPTPAEAALPREKPRASMNQHRAPALAAVPVAPKPSSPERPTRADLDKGRKFEQQVLGQLEQYRQRERKLQVASTDSTPTLAVYLKDLRARLKQQTEGTFAAAKPPTGMIVSLAILKDGSLRGIETDQGSGDARLDRKVISALQQLGRLPPLPAAIHDAAEILGVTVRLPIE